MPKASAVSKTARASVRAGASSARLGPRIEYVLVVESYLKPNGQWGLRRWTDKREVGA